ncbi:uncharacterized protein METZ01_LOCUS484642 [marine metagenome]|uniref:Uncharacterized protein n=1 Tax=marine metagenome TaxID=408172 RepID=A0A383CJJ2_9ZZZZ
MVMAGVILFYKNRILNLSQTTRTELIVSSSAKIEFNSKPII